MLFPFMLFAREHVAIIDFEPIGVSETEAKALTQRLTTELIKIGEFMVLERSEMKKILHEQKFQYSGCVDISCAVAIGKMVGAKYMIVGSVSKIGKTYSVDSRLIKVETGESYGSADFSHTGDIDYLILEGMKAIAYKLSDIEYTVKAPKPVKTTVQMNPQTTNGSTTALGANLSINSNPEGADIYINENFMGNTPLELQNYPIGEYEIKVVKEYYYDEEKIVQLVPLGMKSINMNFICIKKDQCGICGGDDSTCKDDCGVIYGNNKDKDCDGVCFGENLPKEFCYDANGDGDGDINNKKSICVEDAEENWVNYCTPIYGTIHIKSDFNKINSLKISNNYVRRYLNSSVYYPIGEFELSITAEYLFKDFKYKKKFVIEEDKLTEVFISKNDIIKDITTHKKRVMYSSSLAVFLAWITWGLMDYEV